LEDTATDLSQLSVQELIARLSTRAPVPGGGSAAGIAGSLGAALVSMVVELTVGRPDAAGAAAELDEIGAEARRLCDELLDLAQADAAAYDRVVQARKLPRDTDEQRAERRLRLDAANSEAAEIPMRIARAAEAVLGLAVRLAPIGNPNAASDAGVAAQLASAAVRGAALNVRINLPYLPETDPLRVDGPATLERLEAGATELEREALGVVLGRIGPS
jgi:formiminotetrahydrofolate cyclodeaminase